MSDPRPTVAAVLDLKQAGVTSEALVVSILEGAEYLVGHLKTVKTDGMHNPIASKDAEATARDVAAGIAALDEIGWPHELSERINAALEQGEAA